MLRGLAAALLLLTSALPGAAADALRLVLETEEAVIDSTILVLGRRLEAWVDAEQAQRGALSVVTDLFRPAPFAITRQGSGHIAVDLRQAPDAGSVRPLLTRRGVLAFRLIVADISDDMAKETMLLPERGVAEGAIAVREPALLDGSHLAEVEATRDHAGMPVVMIRFDNIGAERFAKATTTAVGQQIAIVVDDEVISAPHIVEPITGGVAQISGNFSFEDAQELALILGAGALPAPVTIISEQWMSGESDE